MLPTQALNSRSFLNMTGTHTIMVAVYFLALTVIYTFPLETKDLVRTTVATVV